MRLAALLALLAGCRAGGSGDTDDAGSFIASVAPVEGSEIWVHDPITIVFSVELDASTLDDALIVTDGEGRPLEATIVLSDDERSVTIRVDPAARAFGSLHVLICGLADVTGQRIATTELSWSVPGWAHASGPTSEGLDRGSAQSPPTLATTAGGDVVAAWAVSSAAADRIVVSLGRGVVWTPMGGELGGIGASAPTVAIDGDGHAVVAWSEDGAIRAARWDGEAWVDLPSPGAGATPVLAATSTGDPVLAWSSLSPLGLRVRSLRGASWEPVGDSDPLIVTESRPAIAADADGRVAVAAVVMETQQLIQVYVLEQGAWVAAPPLVGAAPPDGEGVASLSIGFSTGDLVVAWDEWSGYSWSVQAASMAGGSWTRLGGALDIDPPADARGAVLAVDTAGAPVMAWTEQVESQQRGFAARWNGTSWLLVGGDAWNVDSGRVLDTPALAMARGEVPVVGFRHRGQSGAEAGPPVIASFNGPAEPRFGLDTRASSVDCGLPDPAVLPMTLTETGCFTISDGRAVPGPGLVPFDIVSELWSDGALKRRWLVVPDGEVVVPTDASGWAIPVGAMLIKEFAIETTPGDPSTRRPIETRFLVRRTDTSWAGYSFEWRDDFGDADLVAAGAAYTRSWPLTDGGVHVHSYPSRTQCLICHDDSVGFVLGLRTGQLARRFDYDGVAADQLATLEHIGLIASTPAVDPFAAPHDPSETTYRRVRGYLAANCAHCHNPGGLRPTRDLRWEIPLEDTQLCGVVVPGDPTASLIHQRVSARPGMPPLATLQTDPVVIDLLGAWITSLASCP